MAACRSFTCSLWTHRPMGLGSVSTPYSPQAWRALAVSCAPLHSGQAAADQRIGTGHRRAVPGSPAVNRCISLEETPPPPHQPAVGTLLPLGAHSNVCPQVRTGEPPCWGVEITMHAGCRSGSTAQCRQASSRHPVQHRLPPVFPLAPSEPGPALHGQAEIDGSFDTLGLPHGTYPAPTVHVP